MIIWSLDFIYQCVFRNEHNITETEPVYVISAKGGDIPNHLCPKEQCTLIYQAIVGMMVCLIVRFFCVW